MLQNKYYQNDSVVILLNSSPFSKIDMVMIDE